MHHLQYRCVCQVFHDGPYALRRVQCNPSRRRFTSGPIAGGATSASTYETDMLQSSESLLDRTRMKRYVQARLRKKGKAHSRGGTDCREVPAPSNPLRQPWSKDPLVLDMRNLNVPGDIRAARMKTLCRVEDAVRRKFGLQYSVQVFGSIRCGVAGLRSDMDLVILDPTRPTGFNMTLNEDPKQRISPIYNIKAIARALRDAKFQNVIPVHASVPIVKFTDPLTGIDCDINVNERLGLINSAMVDRYCQLLPLLRPMLKLIKKWAKPLGLNDSARGSNVTFSSYALSLMTIGFLQSRRLLPNLQAGLPPLLPNDTSSTFWPQKPVNMCCDIRFDDRGWELHPKVNPVYIMENWFKFWGEEFNYEEDMMSIRHGGIIPRSRYDSWDTSAASVYRDTTSALVVERKFHPLLSAAVPPPNPSILPIETPSQWKTQPVSVMDPFIRTKNVTRGISDHTLTFFRQECMNAYASGVSLRRDLPQYQERKIRAPLPSPASETDRIITAGTDKTVIHNPRGKLLVPLSSVLRDRSRNTPISSSKETKSSSVSTSSESESEFTWCFAYTTNSASHTSTDPGRTTPVTERVFKDTRIQNSAHALPLVIKTPGLDDEPPETLLCGSYKKP